MRRAWNGRAVAAGRVANGRAGSAQRILKPNTWYFFKTPMTTTTTQAYYLKRMYILKGLSCNVPGNDFAERRHDVIFLARRLGYLLRVMPRKNRRRVPWS